MQPPISTQLLCHNRQRRSTPATATLDRRLEYKFYIISIHMNKYFFYRTSVVVSMLLAKVEVNGEVR